MDSYANTLSGFERHARAKRARIDATDSLGVDIQAESRHLQHAIAAMSKTLEANSSKVTTEVRALRIISLSVWRESNECRRRRNSPDQLRFIRNLPRNA